MANAFAPDIGMDIGGSNYSGRGVVDYSGVAESFANMFNKPKVTQTEASLKRERMVPYADSITKIQESDIPDSRKRILISQVSGSFVSQNPDLSTEVKSVLGLYGIEDVTSGSKPDAYNAIDSWAKLDANKTLDASLRLKATDPNTGVMDETKYYASAAEFLTLDARLEANTKITKVNESEGKAIWDGSTDTAGSYQSFYNLAQKDAAQRFDAATIVKGTLMIGSNAQGPLDPNTLTAEVTIPVITNLTQAMEKQGNAMDRIAIQNHIDISSQEYVAQRKAALSGYQEKIDFLSTNQNNLKALAEASKNIENILTSKYNMETTRAKQALSDYFTVVLGPVMGRSMVNNPDAMLVFWQDYTTLNAEKIAGIADSIAKGGVPVGNMVSASPSNAGGNTFASLSVPQTVLDPNGNPTTIPPGQVTPDTKTRLDGFSTQEKKTIVDTGFAVVKNNAAITSPEAMNHALASVSDMFDLAMISDKPLSSGQVTNMFSTDMQSLIKKVNTSTDDATRAAFNAKVDSASQDQLQKNWMNLSSQVGVIDKAVGGKVFNMSVENGKYTLAINSATVAANPELRKIIRENNVKTPDDLIKAFATNSLYKSMFGEGVVDITKLNESVNNINNITSSIMSLPPELHQAYQATLGYSGRQMTEFNTVATPTKIEAVSAVTTSENAIPENMKKFAPLFDQYFALEDQRKNLAPPAAGQAPDPQIKALADQMTQIRAKLPLNINPGIMDTFRRAYDAKVNATNVETMSANPTRTIPLSEFLRSIGGVK